MRKTINKLYVFTVNGELLGGDPEMYAAQFNRFGGSIKAIQFNHILDIDTTTTTPHWTVQMIQPHINKIEKFTLNVCQFQSNDMFSQPMNNLTHLALRNVYSGSSYKFDFPECRNLIELEIFDTNCFSNKSSKRFVLIHQYSAL